MPMSTIPTGGLIRWAYTQIYYILVLGIIYFLEHWELS